MTTLVQPLPQSSVRSGTRPSARPSDRLTAATLPAGALPAAARDEMWTLFRQYYTETTREKFEHDLAEKDHVLVLRDPAGAIQGFSTLKRLRGEVMRRRFVAVFSGDTIVARAYWGQTALQRAFLSYVMRVKLAHPLTPVYWFLISKGYRTYLLLSRNFPEHWPRYDRATPAWQAAMIDALAGARYPEAFCPGRGVLRFPTSQGRLREHVAPIDAALLEQPDIRFFVEKNPGHACGDELCCLGRVDVWLWLSYMTKLAHRLLASSRRRGAARRLGGSR
ncbi:MAG: hypothetical protein ACXWLM_03345 [Myxococcales bacterium]